MNEKEDLRLIAQQLNIARQAIEEAMKIADRKGLYFRWEVPFTVWRGGDGNGMGGYYYGKGSPEREKASQKDYPEYGEPGNDGWLPSNQSC
jgi:hypothetical protein